MYVGTEPALTVTVEEQIITSSSGGTVKLIRDDATVETDNSLGRIQWVAENESSGSDALLTAAEIEAVAEGDFSASSNATKMDFKTGSSAVASTKMSLSSGGGLTLTGGASKLKVESSSNRTSMIELMGTGTQSTTWAMRIGIPADDSKDSMIGGVVGGMAGLHFSYYYLLPQIQQTTNNGDLRLGGSGYRFHTVYASNALDTSDERVKEEIENLDVGLDFINALTPRKFKYKDKDEDGNYKDGKLDQPNGIKKWGLIAQEVKSVLDSNSISEDIGLWSTDKGECNNVVLEDQQQLQYKELIAPLINSIKELTIKYNALEDKVKALEGG
tara:strand:- start:2918 stop:3904 length:987 start_codon:yes stop_codon:yes gene_type:complete